MISIRICDNDRFLLVLAYYFIFAFVHLAYADPAERNRIEKNLADAINKGDDFAIAQSLDNLVRLADWPVIGRLNNTERESLTSALDTLVRHQKGIAPRSFMLDDTYQPLINIEIPVPLVEYFSKRFAEETHGILNDNDSTYLFRGRTLTAIAPNGKRVLLSAGDRSWIVSMKDKSEIQTQGTVQRAVWSPDGKNIAYRGDGFGLMDGETGAIVMHSRSTLAKRKLQVTIDKSEEPTWDEFFIPFASWSPDSRWFASWGGLLGDHRELNGKRVLMILDVKSGKLSHVEIAGFSPAEPSIPRWSFDSKFIAGWGSKNDKNAIALVNVESEISHTIDGMYPEWSPQHEELYFMQRHSLRMAKILRDGNFSDPERVPNLPQNEFLVGISPDMSRAVVRRGSASAGIDLATGRTLFKSPPRFYLELFSVDGDLFRGSLFSNDLWIYDASTQKLAKLFNTADRGWNELTFSADGQWFGVTQHIPGKEGADSGNVDSINTLIFKTSKLRSKLASAGIEVKSRQ